MNKQELIDAVASAADLQKASAAKAVEAVTDAIQAALAKGDSVALFGFGTFTVKQRPARTVRNPRTGESMAVAASRAVGFKAGKALKDALS